MIQLLIGCSFYQWHYYQLIFASIYLGHLQSILVSNMKIVDDDKHIQMLSLLFIFVIISNQVIFEIFDEIESFLKIGRIRCQFKILKFCNIRLKMDIMILQNLVKFCNNT